MKQQTMILHEKQKMKKCLMCLWKQAVSYADEPVDAPSPKPAGNSTNLNCNDSQRLLRNKTSPQLSIL